MRTYDSCIEGCPIHTNWLRSWKLPFDRRRLVTGRECWGVGINLDRWWPIVRTDTVRDGRCQVVRDFEKFEKILIDGDRWWQVVRDLEKSLSLCWGESNEKCSLMGIKRGKRKLITEIYFVVSLLRTNNAHYFVSHLRTNNAHWWESSEESASSVKQKANLTNAQRANCLIYISRPDTNCHRSSIFRAHLVVSLSNDIFF